MDANDPNLLSSKGIIMNYCLRADVLSPPSVAMADLRI